MPPLQCSLYKVYKGKLVQGIQGLLARSLDFRYNLSVLNGRPGVPATNTSSISGSLLQHAEVY